MNPDWMDESQVRQPAGLWAAEAGQGETASGIQPATAAVPRPVRWIVPALIAIVLFPLLITVWNYAPLGRAWISFQGMKVDSGTPKVSGSCPGKAEWKTTESVPRDSMGTIYNMACRRLESMAGVTPLAIFETCPPLSHRIVTVLQCSSGYFLVTAVTERHLPQADTGTVTVSASPGTFDPNSLGPNPAKKATWELPLYFFN
jgi:hypothetical protein